MNSRRHSTQTSRPEDELNDNTFKQYVLDHLLAHIHPKLWCTGVLFAVAVRFQFDLVSLLMALTLLGATDIALIYWRLRSDGALLRSAMFRFSLYAMLGFFTTVVVFMLAGRQTAIYAGYLVYSLLVVDYLFSLWPFAGKKQG